MIRKQFPVNGYKLGRIFTNYFSSNPPINIEKLEQESSTVNVIDEDIKLKEEQIELSRNKSRLSKSDRNFLFDQNPYPEGEINWYHGTLKYKRRLYGRYGKHSGIDPAICWPIKEELQDTLEYERVAHPFSIREMIEAAQRKKVIRDEETMKRQQDIMAKLSKLEGWKREMAMRIEKKESEANVARERRERLIEEVRKHFGYKVDPKDDKFKELLEKKEKEQKKLLKEARRKEKEAKLMEKLKNKKRDDSTSSNVKESSDKENLAESEQSGN